MFNENSTSVRDVCFLNNNSFALCNSDSKIWRFDLHQQRELNRIGCNSSPFYFCHFRMTWS
jgi:hypothetical protein